VNTIRRLLARLFGVGGLVHRDDELSRELATHLEMAIEEHVRNGMSIEDARRRALIESGGIEVAKEAYRDQRGVPMLELLARDSRFAARSLRKSTGFTTAVVLTLAIAIGANTAIFSAVEAVLIRPLPVPNIDRVVTVGKLLTDDMSHTGLQAAEVFDLETRHDLFDAIAGYRNLNVNLTGTGDPQRIAAAVTTGGFFDVFRVRPFLGRLYDTSVTTTGATHVVVLSYDFWRDLTGGDVRAVGRTIGINDSSYTLIGVLPQGFDYPLDVQLWTPQPLDPILNRRATADGQHVGAIVPTVGRMRPGTTIQQLQSELTAALRGWTERAPKYYLHRMPQTIEARPFIVVWAGDLRPILAMLVGAATLVLLIACANVASLQLVRATGRAREIALRAALGASRPAIARQQITESLLLAAAGGLLGTILGQLLVATVGRIAAERIPELRGLHLDPLLFVCSLVATCVAAVLFGTVPAWRAASVKAGDVLAATAARGTSAGKGRQRFLHTAVVAQVALALVLLLSCGIALRSLDRLIHVDPGFESAGVVTARLVLPPSRYPLTNIPQAFDLLAFHQRLMKRLRGLPGVDAVAEVDVAPFSYRGALDASIHRVSLVKNVGDTVGSHLVAATWWRVDADYFRVMRIPLREGPGFTGHEETDFLRAYPNNGPQDAVIDDALAHRLFPNEDPVGKVIGQVPPGMRVVGVVAAVKSSELGTPTMDAGAIYFSTAEEVADLTLVVRATGSFDRTVALLRQAVREMDPALPLFDIAKLPDVVSRSIGPRALASGILTAFAGVSLLLALLGIYGVLSYSTSQRTREIGIRLALGAEPSDMWRMVVRRGGTLTLIGLGVGLAGYFAFARVLAGVTFGVSTHDLMTMAAAPVVLLACAILACLIPAIRASRVDAVDALRSE
jgi:predicted permease